MHSKLLEFIYNLGVTFIEVGKPDDGVAQPLFSAGTEIDKSWTELHKEFENARELWRLNPMARRVVGLITGYVVGPGMSASVGLSTLKAIAQTPVEQYMAAGLVFSVLPVAFYLAMQRYVVSGLTAGAVKG